MMYSQSQLLDLFNEYLSAYSFDRSPRSLYDPVKYVLSLGGKRIRPVLMMMAHNIYKEEVANILPVAMGIEMYHNYTLLHDDLMDRADKRRGKDTVHRVWNDNAAILSGDAMLVLSYQLVGSCDSSQLQEVMTLFSRTALEICEGQQFDMEFENRNDVSEREYLDMIRLKTAVLLACSLKLGAILAGASIKDADLLYEVGINIGLAFQLKDDLLDVYGDPKVFGKNIGGDILCNKKTFLLINSLVKSNKEQKIILQKWLSATEYVPQEKIAAVKSVYDELGIRMYCEQQIEMYCERAENCLTQLNVLDERKLQLKDIIYNLREREV